MARKRYSVEQIVAAVKQHELGTSVPELCRKLGIAEASFYRWKQQYGGLEAWRRARRANSSSCARRTRS